MRRQMANHSSSKEKLGGDEKRTRGRITGTRIGESNRGTACPATSARDVSLYGRSASVREDAATPQIGPGAPAPIAAAAVEGIAVRTLDDTFAAEEGAPHAPRVAALGHHPAGPVQTQGARVVGADEAEQHVTV